MGKQALAVGLGVLGAVIVAGLVSMVLVKVGAGRFAPALPTRMAA